MTSSMPVAPTDGYWIMTYVEIGVPGAGPSAQFETRQYDSKADAICALREEWGPILSYWQDDDERTEWQLGIAEALAALKANPSAPDVSASVASGELSWGELTVLCEGTWTDFAPIAVDALIEALAEHGPDLEDEDETDEDDEGTDDSEAPAYAQAMSMLTKLQQAQSAGHQPTEDDITTASALVGEALYRLA
jgi:hypothetical protein